MIGFFVRTGFYASFTSPLPTQLATTIPASYSNSNGTASMNCDTTSGGVKIAPTTNAPIGVAVMTDIDKYLSFVLSMFMAFGIAFQVPVAVVLLVRIGFVTVEKLREYRPYVVVGAFVLGAIFTPPDVVSQFMLAVPLLLLYEAGIVVASWVGKGEVRATGTQ